MIDENTGDPLIGANVILEGTTIGAATDINGYFVILNVGPGEYTLKALMIGYGSVRFTNVIVNVDLTTTVDFALKMESIKGEEVIVVSNRKVVKGDVASSQINISYDRIQDLPVTTLEGVIGLQAGIEGMSVRSGSEDELAVKLDGASLKDDRTGKPIMGIPLNSVQEIMIQSGGFNAEYSDLQAGVINVITKDGSIEGYTFNIDYKYSPPAQKYHGESIFSPNSYFLKPYMDDDVCWTGTENGSWDEYTQEQYPSFDGWNAVSEQLCTDNDPDNNLTPEAAQRLFMWQHRLAGDIEKPDINIDAGFGGPVPIVSKAFGNLRFYTSYRQEQDMYLIPLSRDAYSEWAWSTKITSDISSKIKLQISSFIKEISATSSSSAGTPTYFESLWDVADIFAGSSQNNAKIWYPEYYCLTDVSNRMYSAKLTNMLSNKSYYEGLIEYSYTGWNTYPGDTLDPTLKYDIFPGVDDYYVDESPFGFNAALVEGIGGGTFLIGGKTTSRDNTETSRLKFRFDFTTQANQNNQIKSGAELEFYSYHMDYGSVIDWSPTTSTWTEWKQDPYQFNAYVQDKMEFKGWVATAGLRMEYFDPNTKWYLVDYYDKDLFSSNYVSDETNGLVLQKVDGNLTFLPRIGISHPITENSKLYFNYGHMRQKFLPDYLFGIRRGYGNAMSRYGDPSLPMERTVAYELGYDQALFDQYLLHIAAYYKDKSDQAGSVRYVSADNAIDYYQYENNVYQDIRGLEIEFRKRSGDLLTGFVNYTYSVYTSGTFGLSLMHQNPSEQRSYVADVDNQSQYKPLPRPRVNFNLAFHTPRKWGPGIVGTKPLGGWTLAFSGYWKAGSYSSYGGVSGITNNVRWVDTYGVNFKGSKSVNVNKVHLTFICDIYNLFNFKFLSMAALGDQYLSPGDYTKYVESLQFPKKVYDELGQPHIAGEDRLGAYRPTDVEYQELLYVYNRDAVTDPETIYYVGEVDKWLQLNAAGNAEEVSKSKINKLLDNKAYIDNPNIESLMFLNPRNFYFGLKLSYDL
ncbi:MAG: TonB-dependent receptor [Candidatus Neomarinimicrobiota bacterium]